MSIQNTRTSNKSLTSTAELINYLRLLCTIIASQIGDSQSNCQFDFPPYAHPTPSRCPRIVASFFVVSSVRAHNIFTTFQNSSEGGETRKSILKVNLAANIFVYVLFIRLYIENVLNVHFSCLSLLIRILSISFIGINS